MVRAQFDEFAEINKIIEVFLELIFSEHDIVTRFFPKNHHERKWQLKLHSYPSLVIEKTIMYHFFILFRKF